MSIFRPFGPLSPDHALFRGRKAELATLARLCQGEVEAYAFVYGARQTGKTSLLLRLSSHLPLEVITCRVDFQSCSGADTVTACRYLAKQIADSLPGRPAVSSLNSSFDLMSFVAEAVSESGVYRLVLLLEELGALPTATRYDLANILRSIFNARFDSSKRGLARVMVILAGGIELYDLAVTQVSPFYNVCKAIYLSDLYEPDAVGLVIDGLANLGLASSDATPLAAAMYSFVSGHPYLTQRLGHDIELAIDQGEQATVALVQTAAQQIVDTDVLMHHLWRGLKKTGLLDACRHLLEERVHGSRLDEDMAKLELLGLARQLDGYWTVRNSLLERAIRLWLDIQQKGSKAQRLLLEQSQRELMYRFDMLSKRILELDVTIYRETQEHLRQPLVERRKDFEAERAAITMGLADIERQLTGADLNSDP